MKFGRNLPRNQVPEWAPQYIKYKALKKLIKSAAETVRHGEIADTAGKSNRQGTLALLTPLKNSSTPSTETLRMSMASTTRSIVMQLDD